MPARKTTTRKRAPAKKKPAARKPAAKKPAKKKTTARPSTKGHVTKKGRDAMSSKADDQKRRKGGQWSDGYKTAAKKKKHRGG